ncbi:hypothetical protein Tco_0837442 [Tanacetum coccineum]
MEELTDAVMLMARIQPANGNAETVPSYDAKAISEVNAASKVHEQVSHVKRKTIIQTSNDDQIDSNNIFDDPYVENNSGTYYGFADMLDAAPGRQTSKELGYGITDTWDDLEDEIIYSQLDDARYDRALLRARVNMLYRDRPFHRRTALLMEEEARLSRAAWARSMDACDQVHLEGISLRTTVMAQQFKITELQAADRRRQSVILDLLKADYQRQRQSVILDLLKADYQRQRQLVEALKIVKSLKTQMIELQRQQGHAKVPAKPELPEEASSSS